MPDELTTGLNCPRCGGIVSIPEGQMIVQCPYCELRSVVRGERGLRRYQLACRVDRAQAEKAWRSFLSSSLAIARDASSQSKLSEAFIAYVPFWNATGQVMAYAFGQERVGSGKNTRYVAKEKRVVEDMDWNCPACDVGEFGVSKVNMLHTALEPFAPDDLHRLGLVFEPIGSAPQIRQAAEQEFADRVGRKAKLDRLSQRVVRLVRQRLSLVYYPLYIMRYLYRGRSFQVAVDGVSGQVLYGKAPGNTMYRAGMLVGGMAIGAFLAIDMACLFFYAMINTDGDSSELLFVLMAGAFLLGLACMFWGYRQFRFGEQYEYGARPEKNPLQIMSALGNGTDAEKVLDQLMRGRDS